MGLAWSYLGYSTTYNYFTGFAELLAGVLLLSRRTTTIGALVCLGVMTNVFMINMGYDVPVKLLSFNTVLMSLFLLWKDLKRLIYFFFLNRATPAADIAFPHFQKNLKYGLLTVKLLFILSATGLTLARAFAVDVQYGAKAPKPPLYGIYYTETFIRNRDTVPPLETDTLRWKRLIIPNAGNASIQIMNDSAQWYALKIDTTFRTASLSSMDSALFNTSLHYEKDAGYLTLTGKMYNDSVCIKLRRFDENKFLLMNRGFHWINEYPFNR